MNRAMKSVIAGAGLMLALSSPVFAENGTSGMTGPASGGNTVNAPGYTTTNSPVNGTRLGVTVPQGYMTGGERGTTGVNGMAGTGANGTTGIMNRGVNDDANYTTRTGAGSAVRTNNNAYRRYSVNSAGVGNTNVTSQRLRAQAANADNGMDWGWLGLLGLLGLAGLRGRNRETS